MMVHAPAQVQRPRLLRHHSRRSPGSVLGASASMMATYLRPCVMLVTTLTLLSAMAWTPTPAAASILSSHLINTGAQDEGPHSRSERLLGDISVHCNSSVEAIDLYGNVGNQPVNTSLWDLWSSQCLHSCQRFKQPARQHQGLFSKPIPQMARHAVYVLGSVFDTYDLEAQASLLRLRLEAHPMRVVHMYHCDTCQIDTGLPHSLKPFTKVRTPTNQGAVAKCACCCPYLEAGLSLGWMLLGKGCKYSL